MIRKQKTKNEKKKKIIQKMYQTTKLQFFMISIKLNIFISNFVKNVKLYFFAQIIDEKIKKIRNSRSKIQGKARTIQCNLSKIF